MYIKDLVIGKEYILSHAYGKPNQKIKILNVSEKESYKWGKYWEADIIYTSDDCSFGITTSMNTIECERYLHEIITPIKKIT